MPANHLSPLANTQRTSGSGSLRSATRGRNSALARSVTKENIHPINSKASPRVVRDVAQAGNSASDISESKSTRNARIALRTISNVTVSPASQVTPVKATTKSDAGYQVNTPGASKIFVYPYTPTSKPTSSPRKYGFNRVDTVLSPDVFTTTVSTSPETQTRLSQDIPQPGSYNSLTRSPCPSFVLCSSPKGLPPTRRTSLPAPRRSPPPPSRRLSLPTRCVAVADPLPSFITIEAVILPSGLARPRRPTSITTASSKSNKSRSGYVREGMIAASVNRLADLVSVLDNCERRIDEVLGITGTGIESGSGLAGGGLITTGSAFDSDSSMDGSVDSGGQVADSAELEVQTFEYYWNANGDLVRKDSTTDSDVALEECLEKERALEERLERARELVRMRMERRATERRYVY